MGSESNKKKIFDQESAFKSIIGPRAHEGQLQPAAQPGASSASGMVVARKNEAKSKKVLIGLKPSTHEAARRKCEKLGVSFNDAVCQLLEVWLEVGR